MPQESINTDISTQLCDISLTSLSDSVLDISSIATLQRYRLIHCVDFIRHQRLRIYEFGDIQSLSYSAISYVWKGNPIEPCHLARNTWGFFAVKGAEDGDPISIDVLNQACTAASKEGSAYLWLDRACILQESRADKAWQIMQMYHIYKNCHRCFILPGGVGRLVGLDEETAWIQRAWTLQEVLAAGCCMVLFAWEAGPGWFYGQSRGDLEEIVPGRSAVVELHDLLLPYLGGDTFFTDEDDNREKRVKLEPVIFGRLKSHAIALLGALDLDDEDGKDHSGYAVWRSAMLRSSSRPVDMALSIMGLFGVSLDPRAFNENDRVGATMALAREILRKGGAPTWLGLSIHLPVCKEQTTFTDFPITSVGGKALVKTADGTMEVADVIGDFEFLSFWSFREGITGGRIDDDGYLVFSSKAVAVSATGRVRVKNPGDRPVSQTLLNEVGYEDHRWSQSSEPIFIEDTGGRVWEIAKREPNTEDPSVSESNSRAFAVSVGMVLAHPRAACGPILAVFTMRAMLIEEHAPNKFHKTSDVILGYGYDKYVRTWEERTFSVGPDPR